MRFFQLDWALFTLFYNFFPLISLIYELCTNSIWYFKKINWNMLHRTRKEKGTVASNGKLLWKKSSTYGKYMRIIWNNPGHLLVLKIPRQWRKVVKIGGEVGEGWEDMQLTSKDTESPHPTWNRWEPVITHRKSHSHLKEFEHQCFPPIFSLLSHFYAHFSCH